MKNYKGGYKLIDLEKNDMLSIEVGVVIKGIHKAIESSYAKPLLLTGIVIDGVEKNDVYIEELKIVDGSFVFKAYGYEITIDDDDNVEAVEIHVPVIKSVTSAVATKDIDIQDGDEYLVTSTHASYTKFSLPNDVDGLVIANSYSAESFEIYLAGFDYYKGQCSFSLNSNKTVIIKRIGNFVFLTFDGLSI